MMDALHIRLFKAQRLTLPAGAWRARDVRSAFWRFYWNQTDGARLDLDDGPYPLHARTPYLVPAGVYFHCHNDAALDHFYVHFDVIGLGHISMRELFAAPLCLPSLAPLNATTNEIARELPLTDDLDLAWQCRIKGLLFDALAAFLQSVPPEQGLRCFQLTTALAPILPAIDFIEKNLGERLANSELAALCHLSTEHFIRRFHAHVGQPPARYVTERRVAIAAQRLLFTDGSIEQIADETGFGNRFYFSRVFARRMGLSPAAFRRARHV